jgi:sulfur dioxygenase
MQALRPSARSSIAAASGAEADILLQDNDCIKLGSLKLRVIATPGHTNGCLCFYLPPSSSAGGPGLVFTGDALLIRGCGRTDFQQGEGTGYSNATATPSILV